MSRIDELPPHDLESEAALLGGLLTAHEYGDLANCDVDEIRAIVSPGAFYLPDHVRLFGEICRAHEAGDPTDARAILARLQVDDDKTDWRALIDRLCDQAEAANGPFYARKVRECFQRREVIRLTNQTRERAFNITEPLDDTLASLAQGLDSIEQASCADREPATEADLLRGMVNPRAEPDNRVPVTLGNLGRILDGGFERGSETVVGARPSCGKTSLGLGLCVHAAGATGGCPTLFVSAEMGEKQILHRLLAMRSGLPVRRIRSGEIHDEEFNPARNKAAIEADAGETIYILDGVRDVRAIAAIIRRYARRNRIGMAVVDYIGLLNMPGDYERHDLKIGAITALFKALAADTNTCVVLLAQLNRSADRENRPPKLSDLKDSGCIEADADVVLLLHKKDDHHQRICPSDIIVAKQRQGDTGVARVEYDKQRMCYQAGITKPVPAYVGANDA